MFVVVCGLQNPLPWASCPFEKGPNETMIIVPECEKSSETAYFWYREALDISPSIEETGGLKWWMVLCLLLAWVVVYFIIMRGVKSAGKVSKPELKHRLIMYTTRCNTLPVGCKMLLLIRMS